MKKEKKYYVEWSVNDYLHKSEVILGDEIAETLPLEEQHDFVKRWIKEYFKRITVPGTKVKIQSIVYKGTVFRISEKT